MINVRIDILALILSVLLAAASILFVVIMKGN